MKIESFWTPKLDKENTVPVSPMLLRSLQILANSAEGILTIAWYSASGIPRCSLSMSISFISKSEILSCAAIHYQIGSKTANKTRTYQISFRLKTGKSSEHNLKIIHKRLSFSIFIANIFILRFPQKNLMPNKVGRKREIGLKEIHEPSNRKLLKWSQQE